MGIDERNRLVEQNLDLARIIAKSTGSRLPPYVDMRDELLSEARWLLVEAAERYNPERGLPFRTWAQWFINRRIYDLFRRRKLKDLQHTHIEDLRDESGARPLLGEDAQSHEEYIKELGVAGDQEQYAEAALLRDRVQELPPPQQRVLDLHYGAGSSMHSVARELRIKPAAAEKLHTEAIEELREALRVAA